MSIIARICQLCGFVWCNELLCDFENVLSKFVGHGWFFQVKCFNILKGSYLQFTHGFECILLLKILYNEKKKNYGLVILFYILLYKHHRMWKEATDKVNT